jgi:hypothetical protein
LSLWVTIHANRLQDFTHRCFTPDRYRHKHV